MGIPKYFRFVADVYPSSVSRAEVKTEDGDALTSSEHYDGLFVDVNNLLYGHVANVDRAERLYHRLFSCLDEIYAFARPSSTYFLAVDGPGPRAKLITQRARRLEKALQDRSFEGEEDTKGKGQKTQSRARQGQQRNSARMDSLQFTPGTGFMAGLNSALSFYAAQRALFHTPQSQNLEVYFSGADDVGEGELKIFELLKTIETREAATTDNERDSPAVGDTVKGSDHYEDKSVTQKESAQRQSKDGRKAGTAEKEGKKAKKGHGGDERERKKRCLVVGNDSDLIVFSLKLSDRFDVDLLKFMPGYNPSHEMISVSTLRDEILADVFGPAITETTHEERQAVIDDFVLLSILSGNDYMPRLRRFSLLPTWKRYCAVRKGKKFRRQSLWSVSVSADGSHVAKLNSALLREVGASSSKRSAREENDSGSHGQSPRSILAMLASRHRLGLLHVSEPMMVAGEYECTVTLGKNVIGRGRHDLKKKAQFLAVSEALPVVEQMAEKKQLSAESQALLESLNERNVPTEEAEMVHQMESFTQGIAWVMEYFNGRCADYSFLFPYSTGPTLDALTDWAESTGGTISLAQSSDPPLSPIEFSLALLPENKASLYVRKPFADVLKKEEVSAKLKSSSWMRDAPEVMKHLQSSVKDFITTKECTKEAARLHSMNAFSPALLFSRFPNGRFDTEKYVFSPPGRRVRTSPQVPAHGMACLAARQPNMRGVTAFTDPDNHFMQRRSYAALAARPLLSTCQQSSLVWASRALRVLKK